MKKIGFIMVIIAILILSIPILILNIGFLKGTVIYFFSNKENAYQYMQFTGAFLGAALTVIGAIITIEYQVRSEKELQMNNLIKEKEINWQIALRNDALKKILVVKRDLINLRAEIGAVSWAADKACVDNPMEKAVYDDEFRTDVKNNYRNKALVYYDNIADFKIALYEYERALKHIEFNFNELKIKIEELANAEVKVAMKISGFPEYTIGMMNSLLKDTDYEKEKCDELKLQLENLCTELDKYYENENREL